jgi:hypothetical protein
VKAHGFALQICDFVDGLVCKQFVATDMHTGEHGDRSADIERPHMLEWHEHAEIRRTTRQALVNLGPGCDLRVPDICKTLRPQQFLGDEERRDADAAVIGDADGRRFKGPFATHHSWRADEACGTGQRKGGQKAASGLDQRHCKPPTRWPHVNAMLSQQEG